MKYLLLLVFTLLALASCKQGKKEEEGNTLQKDTSVVAVRLEKINRQIEANPGDASLLHQRALLYIEQRNYAQALDDMNRVISIDTTKSAYFITMADLSFAANRTFLAKQHLEKAIALDTTNTEAAMRLAELYLIVREYPQSVALLTKILRNDKGNTTALLMRGINFKENGDTTRAINDFRTAIETDPDYYEAYMQLGILFQLRNDPISEGYFSNALRIRPKSEEAFYGRALWYQEHDNLDKAIQDYTTILQLNPQNKNAHFNLGYIHQNYLKVFPEAIKHYSNAITADMNYAEAYYNRALCYEAIGNLQMAAADFQKAGSLRPGYTAAEEGLRRVSS